MSTEKTTYIFNYVDKGAAAQNATMQRFKKMDKTVDEFEGNYTESTDKMNKSTGKLKQGVNELGAEFPLMGRAIRFATSPMGAFTIAAAATIGILYKANEAATQFNKGFLELEQLNLDKSKEELADLKNRILNLSFDKALNAEAVTKAAFDIQSATGKYGDEVFKIVGRTGEFAQAVQADFNTMIDGVGKATNAFKLQGDQIDDFLISSAKTVQVGVTTFDQLAQVQTEFAGAAAAAGQTYNEANKLFAVFTKDSKNVDIAATKTKGFFEDLSKLEKIDIQVFDEKGGFNKLDKILGDVNKKFKSMDSKSIDQLINKVGGNEGLRGALKAVASNGDAVLQTFKDFDNTDFSIQGALDNANNNLDIMNEKLDNKLNTAFIKLGEVAKPLFIFMKEALLDIIEYAEAFIDSLNFITNIQGFVSEKHKKSERSGEFVIKEQIKTYLGDDFKNLSADDQNLKLQQLRWGLESRLKNNDSKLQQSKDYEDMVSNTNAFERWFNPLASSDATERAVQIQENSKLLSGMLEELNGITDASQLDSLLKSQAQLDFETAQANLGIDAAGSGGGSAIDSLSGVEVAGAQVRNVTVNIQDLIRELNISTDNLELTVEEITELITENIVRSVRDAELTLSSS